MLISSDVFIWAVIVCSKAMLNSYFTVLLFISSLICCNCHGILLKRGLNIVLETKKRKNERLVCCWIAWLDFFFSKIQLNRIKYKNMELYSYFNPKCCKCHWIMSWAMKHPQKPVSRCFHLVVRGRNKLIFRSS